jgi:hypothetical protein
VEVDEGGVVGVIEGMGRGVSVDMFYTRFVIGFGYVRCIYVFGEW